MQCVTSSEKPEDLVTSEAFKFQVINKTKHLTVVYFSILLTPHSDIGRARSRVNGTFDDSLT